MLFLQNSTMPQEQCVFIRGFRVERVLFGIRLIRIGRGRDDKILQLWRNNGIRGASSLLGEMNINNDFRETMAGVVHRPFSVMARTSEVQAQLSTRLGFLSTMKIHNILHHLKNVSSFLGRVINNGLPNASSFRAGNHENPYPSSTVLQSFTTSRGDGSSPYRRPGQPWINAERTGANTSGPHGVTSPLMSTPGNGGIVAGGKFPLPADSSASDTDTAYSYRAKALYPCAYQSGLTFTFDSKMCNRHRVAR